MSTGTAPTELMVVRETGRSQFRRRIQKWACSCGWSTGLHPTGRKGNAAGESQVRGHLADEHGDELGLGRCAECGAPTDWLKAVSEHGVAFLCRDHAPESSLRTVLGAPETEVLP